MSEKKDDEPRRGPGRPRREKPKSKSDRPDEAVPGGRYIQGGRVDPETGRHMGGVVVNAHGETLEEFGDDEENTG